MPEKLKIKLCDKNEIEPETARGFTTTETGTDQEIFVIRKEEQYWGYINSCPHTGAPLEWMPHQFLSLDGESIQCSLHGARFTINSGHCTQGPCINQNLTSIKLETIENTLYWVLPDTE